jgi:serine/threonine protein kinase
MGIVYEARRLADGQPLALKMIVGARPEHVLRFRREAEAVARLRHPHIVQLHDTGEHLGLPFFTMELVRGGSLAARRSTFPLPPDQAARLVEVLARAIHYAHTQGIIHRDLTPANVLLTPAGEPKVSDFGLAKCLDEDSGDLTSTGHIMGTPAYMAPEVAWGRSREAGPPADVHVLGVILYELLVGAPPFRGTPVAILDQVRFEPPRRLTSLRPEVPIELEWVCQGCLAKQPNHRYRTAEELAEELHHFQAGQPLQTQPPASPGDEEEPPPRSTRLTEECEAGSRTPPRTDEFEHPPELSPMAHGPARELPEQTTGELTGEFEDRIGGGKVGPAGFSTATGYQLLEEVGRGGLSVVYRGQHVRLNRPVAVKMAWSPMSPGVLKRFRIEATILSRLDHPNIVRILDCGDFHGDPYFVLELLERHLPTPQPSQEAARMVETLARAMHHVHEQGIVHRNLKPRPVMLTQAGEPKVINFILARAPHLGTGDLDQEGAVVGTPSYMAPEQAQGKTKDVGPAADVYALGGIFYELLTGRPPFKAAGTMDTLLQVLEGKPPSPRSIDYCVDRRLNAICLKCLQKDPADRPASAAELADDLKRYQSRWFG